MLTRRCMEFHPFSLDSAWISLGKIHISQRSIFGSCQMLLVIGKCPSRPGLSIKIEEPKSPSNSLHFGMFIAVEELVLLAHLYNLNVYVYKYIFGIHLILNPMWVKSKSSSIMDALSWYQVTIAIFAIAILTTHLRSKTSCMKGIVAGQRLKKNAY